LSFAFYRRTLADIPIKTAYPFAIFVIYGAHWVQVGYTQDPAHNLVGAYSANGAVGALDKTYNSGNAFYNITL